MASSFYVTVTPTSFFPKTNLLSILLSKNYDPHTKFYLDFRDRLNISKAFLISAIYEVSQVVLVVKNLPANANVGDVRDTGSIPGSGRSPGEGNGNLFQCSCLENPMDRGGWWAEVHGVSKNWTQLKRLSNLACMC